MMCDITYFIIYCRLWIWLEMCSIVSVFVRCGLVCDSVCQGQRVGLLVVRLCESSVCKFV